MGFLELKHLTWPQLRGLPDGAVGLIPVGSLEQHGPHLPLIMDSALADALAASVAGRILEPVIVSPAFPGGMSDHHLGFPGTVTFSSSLFSEIIEAYVRAMAATGIRRVGIISAHGGNFELIGSFASAYSRRSSADIAVKAYDELDSFTHAMFSGGKHAGLNPPVTDLHAGVLETSLALYLFGTGIVRDFADVQGYVAEDRSALAGLATRGVHAFSESGVLGLPAGATAEAGEVIFRYLSDELTKWFAQAYELTEVEQSD
jgi:creatinine amidohydrolase